MNKEVIKYASICKIIKEDSLTLSGDIDGWWFVGKDAQPFGVRFSSLKELDKWVTQYFIDKENQRILDSGDSKLGGIQLPMF